MLQLQLQGDLLVITAAVKPFSDQSRSTHLVVSRPQKQSNNQQHNYGSGTFELAANKQTAIATVTLMITTTIMIIAHAQI